jgi:hypothetical protein
MQFMIFKLYFHSWHRQARRRISTQCEFLEQQRSRGSERYDRRVKYEVNKYNQCKGQEEVPTLAEVW